MNLQNLLGQFGNLGNLFGNNSNNPNYQNQNYTCQNQNQNYQGQNRKSNSYEASSQGISQYYPESFTTPDYKTSNPCTSGNCGINYNNQQNDFNSQEHFQNANAQQNTTSGPFGQNMTLSSLLPLFSMFKGKQNVSSLFSSDSIPDSMKGLAPLISMLASNSDKVKEKETSIDRFKRTDE